MMKEEYEEQLRTSACENEHIASLIYELTEQESSISIEEDKEIERLKKMQAEMAKQIEAVTRERHQIKQEINRADSEHAYNTGLIQKQEERLDELRNV
jgi:phage-related minor tail protein